MKYKNNTVIDLFSTINDNVNTSNFTIIITSMIIVILILVGAFMFAPRK